MSKTYNISLCPRCKCDGSVLRFQSGQPMVVCQKCGNWSWLDDADDDWVKVEGKNDNDTK